MEYLKNVEFVKSVFNKGDLIRDDLPIIAMVGKSNVGKSSFINTLTNNKNTAKKPKICCKDFGVVFLYFEYLLNF